MNNNAFLFDVLHKVRHLKARIQAESRTRVYKVCLQRGPGCTTAYMYTTDKRVAIVDF